MLKHRVRVYVFDEHGNAVLHLAGENGHEGVVDVILWHRTFVNNKSQAGVIPLHLNAENCYNKLDKVLVETQDGHTAVISLLSKSTNKLLIKAKHGHTGIHLAASNGHHVMVSLLLVQGADVDIYNKRRLDMPSNV